MMLRLAEPAGRRKGVTLIETLVAIVIIALLAVLFYAALVNQAKYEARKTEAAAKAAEEKKAELAFTIEALERVARNCRARVELPFPDELGNDNWAEIAANFGYRYGGNLQVVQFEARAYRELNIRPWSVVKAEIDQGAEPSTVWWMHERFYYAPLEGRSYEPNPSPDTPCFLLAQDGELVCLVAFADAHVEACNAQRLQALGINKEPVVSYGLPKWRKFGHYLPLSEWLKRQQAEGRND